MKLSWAAKIIFVGRRPVSSRTTTNRTSRYGALRVRTVFRTITTVPWSKIHERYRLEALTYFIGIRRALARVADALSLVPEKNA